jgi:HEAT repeats
MRVRLFLVVPLLFALVSPVSAGIIFGRKKNEKPPAPTERVPELINILRTDRDDDHRARAVEELRTYDTTTFPVIVPAIIESLRTDPKPNVRSEAITSLSKIRPISDAAGQALEHALATDPSMRVRMQARSALLGYHWAGYHPAKKADNPPPLTGKQPAPVLAPAPVPTQRSTAEPPRIAPAAPVVPPIINTPLPPPIVTTPAPAPVVPNSNPMTPPVEPGTILGGPKRLPDGPTQTPRTPPTPPESKAPAGDGPDLGSPF